MKTVFDRYLEESEKLVRRYYGKLITYEILFQFFPKKIATPTPNIRLNSEKKNAILLVGKSCCGKTTFARGFCQKHLDFSYISMDDCALRDLELMSQEEQNEYCQDAKFLYTLGSCRFGNMIATGNNIIIDGGWGHINAIGAVLKTLEFFDYYTTIISMTHIPDSLHFERREKRVLNNLAKEILNISSSDYTKDYITIYARNNFLSYENAIKQLRKSPGYEKSMLLDHLLKKKEDRGAMWEFQEENNLFRIGADAIYYQEY